MNPVAKKLWVDKLTSLASTEQAFGPLREKVGNGQYKLCAIGALVQCYCEKYGKKWGDVAEGLVVDEDVFLWADYNPWVELIQVRDLTARVFDLNDHFKIPLAEIAQGIQKDL